ncbi:hypothetical protein L7F22_003593 [Adiantum nelumboides]|nr:hypothetical protein [Adiantum nelumboides]
MNFHLATLLAVTLGAYYCAFATKGHTIGGCAYLPSTGTYVPNRNVTQQEIDTFHFAMNVEYLEAEWFSWAAFGYGLDVVAPYFARGPPPIGVHRANLDELTYSICAQFAWQEVDHLRAIWETTGGMRRPLIDLSENIWATLMNQAFGFILVPPFNPYEDGMKFLLASYIIPYIGLTGYVGANPLLTTATAKRLLAGLEGVESGQDGVIRAYLYERRNERVSGYIYTVAQFTDAISNLRNRLGRTGVVDEGLVVPMCLGAHSSTTQNVLSADRFSLSYSRTPEQILRILYGTGNESLPGAFYPRGANGRIARQYLDSFPF